MYVVMLVLLFATGVVLERVGYAPLRKRPPITIVISTLALGLLIQALLGLKFGTQAVSLPSPFGLKTVNVFGAAVSEQSILTIAVTIVIGFALFVFFQRSPVGRQVRALAADRETAILQGIRVSRLTPVIFGVSAALAGLAGVLLAPQTGGITTLFGYNLLLNAFAAVILGGERLGGVAFAAMFLAVAQVLLGAYLWPSYQDAYPFLILVIALVIRPQGLVRMVGGVRY
jgi:branched-chain amino acid transport system permease protein